jgi:hypothetical protein
VSFMERQMNLKARVDRLERSYRSVFRPVSPTDKMPLEVLRRFMEGTNTPAEFRRWQPLLQEMIAAASAAEEDRELVE